MIRSAEIAKTLSIVAGVFNVGVGDVLHLRIHLFELCTEAILLS